MAQVRARPNSTARRGRSVSRSNSRSMSGSVTRSSSRSNSPKNVKEGQINKAEKTSSCESISEITTTDTVSAIQHNAHWKESDFSHDFTDPKIDHDRILLVGGKDLHVISNILMETSDFFKILFGENFKESSQEKIELKDVETEDFIEFLNHLYSNDKKITKDNFFTLYTLADRFLTPMIFKKCNDFIKEDPDLINDFGQRAFDLLQMAIDMDLKDIKNVLRQHLFTKSSVLLCKKCKQVPNLMKKKGVVYKSSNIKKNGILEGALYLPNDHICMEHRDYILDQNPKIIAFILESLVNSVHEVHCHSYDYTPRTESSGRSSYNSDGESAKSIVNTEKLLSTKKLFIYNFTKEGPYHDSTILVKDLAKDTEQIFNVDSKIVCSGAKWFRGRLENESQLVLTDVSAAHFELYLNYIYPNAHPVAVDNFLILLEMSARFESSCLYRKVFKQLEEEIEEILDEPEKTIPLIEIAMNYNLREIKKLFYKRVIEPFGKMTATLEPCQAKEGIKKHQFKPDGVKNSLNNAIFYDDAIRKMSPEAQRFVLSCILKNVNKCL